MTNVPPASQPQQPLGAPAMPPTPRDIGPSESEIIPFRSSKINIRKSGILIPVAATAVATILLFSLNVTDYVQYYKVLAAYLLFCIFYAVYVYSGIKKSIFIYLIPVAIIYVELNTPILNFFIFVFRTILPGGDPKDPDLINTFVSMFFGAGLMEELMKAIPALIGLSLALRVAGKPADGVVGRFSEWMKVTTPIEGMILGVATGAGFIFVETIFMYVLPKAVEVAQRTNSREAGLLFGMGLLLPRVLQGVVGHMAWAGISGYFIGLAARYPRSIIKLLVIAWLAPSTLHALWNSSGYMGGFGEWIAAAPTLLLFVACLLKAKQLDAVRLGAAFVPTDSIIVGGAPLPVATGTLSEQHATAWGGLSQVIGALFHPRAAAAPPGALAAGTPAPAAPAAPRVAPSAVPVPRFILSNGADRFGIVAGQTIDLAMLFPGRGLAAGTLAEVTAHPQDPQAVGLKNMTSGTWAVTLDTGATTTVAAGRSVKLVANEKIKIGDVTIDVQAL